MRIGEREINYCAPVYVIAEISANHCYSSSMASVLIESAAAVGADAVKFQTFTWQEFIHPDIRVPLGYDAKIDGRLALHDDPKMLYLFKNGGLPRAWHGALHEVASDCGIDFLSTPFSIDGAKFLVEEIGVKAIKIASGDLTYTPLLQYVSATGLPIILSTGGATAEEIAKAVGGPLADAYHGGRLAILHCRSVYPCPPQDVGIQAIARLKEVFPLAQIGFSDHTISADIIPALVAREGVSIYEKHICLDVFRTSADTGHSLTVIEFAKMVSTIRSVPQIMYGTGVEPIEAERHDRCWARRCQEDWLRPTQPAREGVWE